MCIQFLPEDLMIAAQMSEQDRSLAPSMLSALAADDEREAASKHPGAVRIMSQCISEFCPEEPTLPGQSQGLS